jgi:hypothetical protein
MLWVDYDTYCGPDRRRIRCGMRLRERRRYNYAAPPPPLPTAMRQLRMRILDAHGPGADAFARRAQSVAVLARYQNEHDASAALLSLATIAARGQQNDTRQMLYAALDRAHAVLQRPH